MHGNFFLLNCQKKTFFPQKNLAALRVGSLADLGKPVEFTGLPEWMHGICDELSYRLHAVPLASAVFSFPEGSQP